MGSDWRDQISSIIADTNRNLGGRGLTTIASVPPLAYCSARPAEFESVFRGGPSATAGAISGGGGGGGAVGFNLTESPKKAAAAAAHQAHATSQAAAQQSPLEALMSDKQQANLTSQAANFQGSLQRILESVKFELDVRGSIAQKHMEAVREEMTAGMQEAERRCLDVAKQVDAAVGVRLDTERQIREQTNSTIARLQDTMSESHKETVRVVSDFQSTSIDHAEVLRRLEQELTLTLTRCCGGWSRSCSPSSSTRRPSSPRRRVSSAASSSTSARSARTSTSPRRTARWDGSRRWSSLCSRSARCARRSSTRSSPCKP